MCFQRPAFACFSIATTSMKTGISFRPGVNIKTNSFKLSHKQSLEKLSRQNEAEYATTKEDLFGVPI